MRGSNAEYRENKKRLDALAERYHGDAGLRSRIESGDTRDAVRQLEIVLPQGVEARISADTEDVTHIVFPPDPNIPLADEDLQAASGGGASSIGSAGTMSSIPSCISSAGTVSSWSG